MCNLCLTQYLALTGRIYVQSTMKTPWIFMNKKHLTSFENVLIKKKTKRYEPGQRYLTSKKTSLHHPGNVVYAPVTSQGGMIQQMLR